MKFIIILFFPVYVFAVSAQNPCLTYQVKNKEMSCQSDDYLLRFGYRYCSLFLNQAKIFSPKAQAILAKIRWCLAEHVEKAKGLTCDQIENWLTQVMFLVICKVVFVTCLNWIN